MTNSSGRPRAPTVSHTQTHLDEVVWERAFCQIHRTSYLIVKPSLSISTRCFPFESGFSQGASSVSIDVRSILRSQRGRLGTWRTDRTFRVGHCSPSLEIKKYPSEIIHVLSVKDSDFTLDREDFVNELGNTTEKCVQWTWPPFEQYTRPEVDSTNEADDARWR